MNKSDERIFYTDGGSYNTASGNMDKGTGAWAFVEFNENLDNAIVFCGYESDTTNNRMEMMAVINAIRYGSDAAINIISDSGYVVKGYNHPAYLDKWVANGWRTSSGGKVLNQDLWNEILALSYHNAIRFSLVRGHYKDPNPTHALWNSIVDRACTWVMQNYRGKDVIELQYNFNDKSMTQLNQAAGRYI